MTAIRSRSSIGRFALAHVSHGLRRTGDEAPSPSANSRTIRVLSINLSRIRLVRCTMPFVGCRSICGKRQSDTRMMQGRILAGHPSTTSASPLTAVIMAHPLPLGAFHRGLVGGCHGGPPLWQNTIEYKWLGSGEVLDGCVVLEVVRRAVARRLQKRGTL
jgi:hypothetical protein